MKGMKHMKSGGYGSMGSGKGGPGAGKTQDCSGPARSAPASIGAGNKGKVNQPSRQNSSVPQKSGMGRGYAR